MIRHSTIHPYPAMMPQELVANLVEEYAGRRLLDPFCGTGRVCVAAAEIGASTVGIDINPLAVLISCSKTGSPNESDLDLVLDELAEARHCSNSSMAVPIDERAGRKVQWFGEQAARELGAIVAAINRRRRRWPTQLLLAAVLSATTREVSFTRRDQWKLHRLGPLARPTVDQNAWAVFERRLHRVRSELATLHCLPGSCQFLLGDARDAAALLRQAQPEGLVDTIITSPPYGDSRSTVQYGGVSALCMAVVSKIVGFERYGRAMASVDRNGLGGRVLPTATETNGIPTNYWTGGRSNPRRRAAGAYLRDLRSSVRAAAACLRPGGLFVTVIARRLIGGWRLRADRLVDDALVDLGFVLVRRTRRRIAGKVTPPTVNRSGGSTHTVKCRRAQTMREEWILVHRAPNRASSSGIS